MELPADFDFIHALGQPQSPYLNEAFARYKLLIFNNSILGTSILLPEVPIPENLVRFIAPKNLVVELATNDESLQMGVDESYTLT